MKMNELLSGWLAATFGAQKREEEAPGAIVLLQTIIPPTLLLQKHIPQAHTLLACVPGDNFDCHDTTSLPVPSKRKKRKKRKSASVLAERPVRDNRKIAARQMDLLLHW